MTGVPEDSAGPLCGFTRVSCGSSQDTWVGPFGSTNPLQLLHFSGLWRTIPLFTQDASSICMGDDLSTRHCGRATVEKAISLV